MASSFTITQPFLGAPLQFQPALGTQELENLIDFYVPGTASKQDKLSNVTIDFYLNATVDINSGALTKTYNVFPSEWNSQSFEQSPTQSSSSSFSPAIYTPSPGSSATFGQDSGYGSLTMTPPTKTRGGRVAKKAKKETKKVDEARLPGFSIMTKDGIDVTSTAGRGTKTKEQREHAHLMRIIKACDDCKRKKVRCDPSHRRSHNDMSRSSTSTSKSSNNLNPSPTDSAPSLSRQSTQSSASASFSPSNGIDDFILFPEGSDAWNPADLPLETQDISQFNFDINAIDYTNYSPMTGSLQSFDYSFYQPSSFQSSQSSFTQQFSDQFDWVDSVDLQLQIPQVSSQSSSQNNHPSPLSQSGQLSPLSQSGQLNQQLGQSPLSQSGQLNQQLSLSPLSQSGQLSQVDQGFLMIPTSRPLLSSRSQNSLLADPPYTGLEPMQLVARDTSTVQSQSPGSKPNRKRSAPHDELQQQALAGLHVSTSSPFSLLSNSPYDSLILVDSSDPSGSGRLPEGHTLQSHAHANLTVNERGYASLSNNGGSQVQRQQQQQPQGSSLGQLSPTVRSGSEPNIVQNQSQTQSQSQAQSQSSHYSPGLQHSESLNIPDYARDSFAPSRNIQAYDTTGGSGFGGELLHTLTQYSRNLSMSTAFSIALLVFTSLFAAPALNWFSLIQTHCVDWLAAQNPLVAVATLVFSAALIALVPDYLEGVMYHSDVLNLEMGKWAALAVLGFLTGSNRGSKLGDDSCYAGNRETTMVFGDEFLDIFEELRSCTVMGMS